MNSQRSNNQNEEKPPLNIKNGHGASILRKNAS